MYEVWTRGRAWPGLSMPQVTYAVAVEHRRPAVPPGCPDAYARLMQQCWAQAAEDRQGGKGLRGLSMCCQVLEQQ